MAFWDIDLTTRMGAETATWQGSIGCFIFAGLAVLGMVLFGGITGLDTPEGIAGVALIGLEALVGLIAGLRLRVGKGAYWGIAVVILLVLEMIGKLVSLTGIPGLVVNAVILVVIINGVRAAFALKAGAGFEDDIAEVFE